MLNLKCLPLLTIALLASTQSLAADWSTTELQWQHGDIEVPTTVPGRTASSASTHIITLQNATGWKYGNTFFFIDYLDDDVHDGFNDRDFYGELYLNFSLGKITGSEIKFGAVKDVGVLLGVNAGADSGVLKYLPGLRLSWDIPGFSYLNSDFMAYIDDSAGLGDGGIPATDDSQMIDINWAYPFTIGQHRFSIVGHMEYIDGRDNELNQTLEGSFLAQPQFRYDLGSSLWQTPDQVFVGVEWQYWKNKLGDGNTDENVVQALVVWRL